MKKTDRKLAGERFALPGLELICAYSRLKQGEGPLENRGDLRLAAEKGFLLLFQAPIEPVIYTVPRLSSAPRTT